MPVRRNTNTPPKGQRDARWAHGGVLRTCPLDGVTSIMSAPSFQGSRVVDASRRLFGGGPPSASRRRGFSLFRC